MSAPASSPLVPGDHLIVLAAQRDEVAQHCASVLTQVGYPVVLCAEEKAGFSVIETVSDDQPHLLIVDHAIEWIPGIPVVHRLSADPAFAALPMLILLPLEAGFPQWLERDCSRSPFLTDLFSQEDLLYFVSRTLEMQMAGEGPPFRHIGPSPVHKHADWTSWKKTIIAHALGDATGLGDRARLESLLAQGATVRDKDSVKATPLHAAVRAGQIEMARFLLQHGADVNAVAWNTVSPLWVAVHHPRLDMVRLLLEQGADVHKKGFNGATPLLGALRFKADTEDDRKRLKENVALLLGYGSDPNARDSDGRTPLSRAQQHHLPEIAHLLHSYGARE